MKPLPILLALAFVAAACGDQHLSTGPGAIRASLAGNGVAAQIALDQLEAAVNIGVPWSNGGTHVGKEFDQNPHLGDAIVASFVWRGTTNTIVEVTDHLEDETPVGNTYTLAEYTTADGWSMATYVATNVRNFPDPAPSPNKQLAVHAIFSEPITDGGEMISAYSGVSPVSALALGAHHSATGTGSTTTMADPGAIPVDASALVYAFTMSNGVVDLTQPAGFSWLTGVWNTTDKVAGAYAVQSDAGVVDPQWTWSFQAPSTWFASVLALNPQIATHLGFVTQPSYTLLPGSTITPPVQIAVLDDQGNRVTGFRGSVTVAMAHDGSIFQNAHLSGTAVEPVVNGIATFADLSIDQPGAGYTLRAAADPLTAGTSAPFNVTLP